jgi:hypothetical protein
MAVILIKDLADSVELDKQAMSAIAGGARSSGRRSVRSLATRATGTKIVHFATGDIGSAVQAPQPSVQSKKPRK